MLISSNTSGIGNHQFGSTLSYRKLGDEALRYPYTEPGSGLQKEGVRSNEREIMNGVLNYSFSPTKDTEYYTSAYVFNLDHNQLPGAGRAIFNASLMEDKDWSDYSSLTSVIKAGVNHEYGNQSSLSAFAYYWQNDDYFSSDLRSTFLDFRLDEHREESHWGLQLLNRHRFGDSSTLAYGYGYRAASLDEFVETLTGSDGNVTKSHRDESGYSDKIHSLFIDGRSPLLSTNIDVVYGLRLDKYTLFDLQYSPRFGFIGPIGDNSIWKLLYGHAFRAPNLFHLYGSASIAPNFDIEPDQLDNIELVLQKQTQFSFVSLTLFKNWWHDAIRTVDLVPVQGNFTQQYQNVGENEAYGIEVESLIQKGKGRADMTASYIRSKNVDLGEYYDAFPDWMMNVGLGYRLNSQWDAYLSNRYHHRKEASYPANIPQGSSAFFRTDVVVSWYKSDSLVVRFSVRNLLDRENYWPSYFDHEEGIPDSRINASISMDLQF